jgi:arabinan endo-1,5-alpha-L-arabinosidase
MIRPSSVAGAVAAMLAATVAEIPGSRSAAAVFQEVLQLDGDVAPVHDPAVIKEKSTYYLFCTGGRAGQGVIPIRTSTNLRTCCREDGDPARCRVPRNVTPRTTCRFRAAS